jgi:hypothetical protein
MGTSLIIKYITSETLDHTADQILRTKPAVIEDFENKITNTVEKYFGLFTNNYGGKLYKNKITKIIENNKTLTGNQIILSISEKVRSDEPTGLVLLFNKIFENKVTDETITYNTTMRIRGPRKKLYETESQPAIDELIAILEGHKAIDRDAKIKYKFSNFS